MTSGAEFNIIVATSIPGPVTISKPKVSIDEVKRLINEWIAKQDQFWPPELTGEVLTKNLRVIHAAHWILSGAASGNWSASIGVDRKQYIPCSNCSGRGRYRAADFSGNIKDFPCPHCDARGVQERTVTDWHSQSGVARGSVDQHIIENVAADTEIRCGKRDYSAPEYQLAKRDDVLVFAPERIEHEAGLSRAKDAVVSALNSDANAAASGLGRVRDLRLGYVNIERHEARTWLYPIYSSKYEYEGSSHLVEVDGITGKVFVEVPKSVRSQRTAHGLRTAAIISIPILIVFLLIYLANQRSSQLPYVAPAPPPTSTLAPARSSINTAGTATVRARATAVRATAQARETATAAAKTSQRATATAQAIAGQSLTGRVTGDALRVRPGPGTEYDPPIARLRLGTIVSIIGWNEASDGTRWWKIDSPSGWVSSEFIDERGCLDCAPKVNP